MNFYDKPAKKKKQNYKYNKKAGHDNYEGKIILYYSNYYEITSIRPSADANSMLYIKNIDNNSDTKCIQHNDNAIVYLSTEEASRIDKAQCFTEKYNQCIDKLNTKLSLEESEFMTTSVTFVMELMDKKNCGITITQLDNIARHLTLSKKKCFELYQFTKNPFCFIQQEIQLITYEKAEKICELYNIHISFDIKCQKWTFDFIRAFNCFYVESRKFWEMFSAYCETNTKNYEKYCSVVNKVIMDKMIHGKYYKTTTYLYELEKKMGDTMMNLYHEKKYNISPELIQQKILLFEKSIGPDFKLEHSQNEAIINSILYKFNCITGYPGTGKSTIVKCILFVFHSIFQKEEEESNPIPTAIATMVNAGDTPSSCVNRIFADAVVVSNDNTDVESLNESFVHVYIKDCCKYVEYSKISILAPTGLAYLGLKNKCLGGGVNGSKEHAYFNKELSGTCHRMIYKHFHTLDKENYPKLLIIDEVSMIDSFMFHHILTFCEKFGCRLILIGDDNQLPSIGPGTILKNIMDSFLFNRTILTEIKRQNEGVLVNNIKKMNESKITIDDFSDESMIFLDIHDFEKEHSSIQQLIEKYMLTADNTKFLTYFNKKTYQFNVSNVNKVMQNLFNSFTHNKDIPANMKYQADKYTFKENDIIVRIVNSYSKGDDIRANGEMAKIISYDGSHKIVIQYLEDNVEMKIGKMELYDEFELAYGLTVHKSQGSQFSNVVIFIDVNQYSWDKRSLYTAISRAKNKCIIIAKYADFIKIQTNKRNDDDKVSLFLKEFDDYEIE